MLVWRPWELVGLGTPWFGCDWERNGGIERDGRACVCSQGEELGFGHVCLSPYLSLSPYLGFWFYG